LLLLLLLQLQLVLLLLLLLLLLLQLLLFLLLLLTRQRGTVTGGGPRLGRREYGRRRRRRRAAQVRESPLTEGSQTRCSSAGGVRREYIRGLRRAGQGPAAAAVDMPCETARPFREPCASLPTRDAWAWA